MTHAHTPFERLLPAWLAVSIVLHALVLAVASRLPEGRPETRAQALRMVVAGRVTEAPADAAPEAPRAEAALDAERSSAPVVEPRARTEHSTADRRAERTTPSAQHSSRSYARAGTAAARPEAADVPEAAPSRDAATGGDRLAEMPHGTSASAPRMGRSGAAFDGPLAGGGAEPLTRTTTGRPSFAVTAPTPSGGSGPGLGGSGSGLGVGGSSGGIGGGGTPGGQGIAAGGVGGSGAGYVASSGTVGGGPGRSSAKSAPSRSQPAAPPAPEPEPPAQHAQQPAPDPGAGQESEPEPEPAKPSARDLSRFRSMVQSRINGARRYPGSARRRGWEGTARVSFSVAPSGRPTGVSLASSSGYQALDAEALRAVRRAAPYRPFPQNLSTSIRVTATVSFRLN